MSVKHIAVERFSLRSPHDFEQVLALISAGIGRPDMERFREQSAAAETEMELAAIVRNAIGPSGLMEFVRLDLGGISRMRLGNQARKGIRLIVGNPTMMKQMVELVPDAGSYAPMTILIDDRTDGVHISYDRMAGFLAPHGSDEALKVARDLDARVEKLLTAAAALSVEEGPVVTQQEDERCEAWTRVISRNCNALFQMALLLTADPKAAEASVAAGIENLDVSSFPGNNAIAGVQKDVAKYAIHALAADRPAEQARARSMLQIGLWPVLEIEGFPRLCFVVRLLMGYSTSLCAQMLGISEAEVKAWLVVAMRQLSQLSKAAGSATSRVPDSDPQGLLEGRIAVR